MRDATEEGSTFEDHLTTALTQRHCPICYMLSDKTYNLLCQLQHDAVHNAEVKAYVTAAGGYCNFHFWYVEKLTSPVTNAQFLQSLLEKIRAEILDPQNAPHGAFTCLTIEARCPVCRVCRSWEEELLALFAAKLPEQGFWAAYQHRRGLCLPHLAQILDRLPDPEARSALVTAACHQLDDLIKELRLQIIKWQTKERILGEERDFTYRAIEKLVGGNRYRTH